MVVTRATAQQSDATRPASGRSTASGPARTIAPASGAGTAGSVGFGGEVLCAPTASPTPYLDLSLRQQCIGGHEQPPQHYPARPVVPCCRTGCRAAFRSRKQPAASALVRHYWRGPLCLRRWRAPVRLPLCTDAGGGQVARGMAGRAKPSGDSGGGCCISPLRRGPNSAGLSTAARMFTQRHRQRRSCSRPLVSPPLRRNSPDGESLWTQLGPSAKCLQSATRSELALRP